MYNSLPKGSIIKEESIDNELILSDNNDNTNNGMTKLILNTLKDKSITFDWTPVSHTNEEAYSPNTFTGNHPYCELIISLLKNSTNKKMVIHCTAFKDNIIIHGIGDNTK